ncbi:MAG TPA: Ada metal-binding domain-containing protein [Pirellulaceae bacterium]|jgi:methylphosphotriester-DNA--protein-cysteine methyltransferase
MTSTDDICCRALKARDTRFDGVFFVGVKTTEIYCRRVCMVQVALAAGFESARRFNALFRSHYHLTPSAAAQCVEDGRSGFSAIGGCLSWIPEPIVDRPT